MDTWNNLFRHWVNLFQPKGHHQCQRQLASWCFCIYFLLAFQHWTVNTFHCFVNLSQTNVLTAVLTIFLLLHQPSHSQAKLFWNLFRGEPHYIRLNNLNGNSAVKVSFVVMNTDHKLSPELLSLLFFIILFLAVIFQEHWGNSLHCVCQSAFHSSD